MTRLACPDAAELRRSARREAVCQAAEALSQEDLVVRTFPQRLPRQKVSAAPALAFNSQRRPSDSSHRGRGAPRDSPCKRGGKSSSESRTAAFSVMLGRDGRVGLLLVPDGHVSTGGKNSEFNVTQFV